MAQRKIRVFYGDPDTGRSWHEENDVAGMIGRSMGPIKVPLMLKSRRSDGGPALLDHCVVAVVSGPGRFDYRHPGFDPGKWSWKQEIDGKYVEAAYCDGQLHARFGKAGQAARYCEFMRGERLSA